MNDVGGIITTAIAVFGFIATILKFSVIKPLQIENKHNAERWEEAKERLEKQSDENKKNIKEMQERFEEISNQVIRDAQDTQNGLTRLAIVEKRLNNLLENCRNCNNRK